MYSQPNQIRYYREEELSPPFTGPRIKKSALLWTLIGCLVVAAIIILTDGSVLAGVGFLGLVAVIVLTFYRLDLGFYLFFGAVMLFDQFPVAGFNQWTFQVSYFRNLNAVPYLPSVSGGVVSFMELHFAMLIFVWFLVLAVRKDTVFVRVPMWGGVIAFLIWVLVSYGYGAVRGGDTVAALWEIRALFYLGVFYFFVPQVIQTREQIVTLLWIAIVAISFKAIQGIERFIGLGLTFAGRDLLTGDEDALFIITLIIFLIGLSFFCANHKQRRAILWLMPILFLGMVVANRRAAIVSFGVSMLAFLVLLPRKERLSLVRLMSVGLVVLGVYLAIFWNDQSGMGIVAQQIKSTVFRDASMIGTRNYSSNLAREYENYNLAFTGRLAPLMGIGFGMRYYFVVGSWYFLNNYALLPYIAHNGFLWLFVKSGSIGFFLFFVLLDAYLFRGGWVFSKIKDPYFKAVAALCILAVINQMVVAYVEMHLTFYRNMIYMGTLMSLMPVIEILDQRQQIEEAALKN